MNKRRREKGRGGKRRGAQGSRADFSSSYRTLFTRCEDIVRTRIDDQKAQSIIGSLKEQEGVLHAFFADSPREAESFERLEILHAVRVSAFFAGVFSFLPQHQTRRPQYEATWYHVHSLLFDTLDAHPATMISRTLLSAVEVVRGEICDAYRLVPFHRGMRIPEECTLFFDVLGIASSLLAKHFQLQMVIRPHDRSEEHSGTFRSKYSGDTERYPIDFRTCVYNDLRRYFPGSPIQVPERVMEAIRGTYSESIDQLVPEDNHLLSALLLSIPSLAFALRVGDFYPERFIDERISFARTDSPSWGYAWTVSLSRMFFSDAGQPSDTAQRVQESRVFGPFELIDGILDSVSRPWGHSIQMEFFQKMRAAAPAFANGTISQEQLLLRIRERSRVAQTIDSSFARQQLGLYIDDCDKVRVIQLAAWSLSSLADSNEESQEYRLVRGNITQTVGPLLREQIDEFEWLIGRDVPEAEFQRFLERNPFLLNALGTYSRAAPHVILHQDDGSTLIPDFFLEFADRRESDILELKLPSERLDVRSRSRDRLRANVHTAVGQLRVYRDWFRSESHRKRFIQLTGMKCFLPRAILVIGRSADFKSELDRSGLQETLPDWVSLRTYDDLLRSAREWETKLRLAQKGSGVLSRPFA